MINGSRPTKLSSDKLLSLSHARSLINGLARESETSTVTRQVRFYAVPSNQVSQYDTLILQVVEQTLRDASIQFVKTNGHIGKNELKRSNEAFAFISGTGLEMMVQFYHLDLDPGYLRYKFYSRFHVSRT